MSMFDDHVAEGKGMQIRRKKRKTQQGKEATAHPIHTDEEVEEQDQECDDVDSIFKGMHTYMLGENDGEILKAGKKKSHSVTTAVASSRSTVDDSEDELVRRRIEKKRFMSSKADVILGSDVSGRHGGGPARQMMKKKKRESSKGLPMEDKEEFKKLSREIQHFGTCCSLSLYTYIYISVCMCVEQGTPWDRDFVSALPIIPCRVLLQTSRCVLLHISTLRRLIVQHKCHYSRMTVHE